MAITLNHGAGRRLAGPEDRDVLAPVVGEAAEPVEELQLRARGRGCSVASTASAGCDGRGAIRSGRSSRMTWSARLPRRLSRTARAAAEQQRPILVGELVAAQDVHPRRGLDERRGTRIDWLVRTTRLERVVEVLRVGGAVLVDDHEVDVEQLQPPVLVGAEQLADDVEVLGLVDPHQDDRQVAGDAVRPQARTRRARCAASTPAAGRSDGSE